MTTICTCFGFGEEDLKRLAAERGIATQEELTRMTSAGSGCRTCVPDLQRLLEELWKEGKPPAGARSPEQVVTDALRPFLGKSAWDLVVMEVNAAAVRLRAIPRREACADAQETLRVFVQKRLQEMYRPDAAVSFEP